MAMTNAELTGAKRMLAEIESDADAAYWVTVCAPKLIAEVERLLAEVERLESELADTEADARQAWREQRLDDQLLGTFS